MIQTIYDIIKTHGGEIKVKTKVEEGDNDAFEKGQDAEFIIQLPFIKIPNLRLKKRTKTLHTLLL